MAELGYIFQQSNHAYSLKITIRARPTEKHFDPQQVIFPVFTADGRIERLTVTHPWRQRTQYRVCIGRVILRDRKEKVVQVATCGGRLTIDYGDAYTECNLTSPAPFFELVEVPRSSETTLFIMIEGLLAKKRAESGYDQAVYEKKLAVVDPLKLFMASLATLEEKLSSIPGVNGLYQESLNVIRKEIQLLQQRGEWPMSAPTLDDLI